MTYHNSVLLQPVLRFLNIQVGNKYIDATLGGGGHTKAIVSRGGQVLGLDQDEQAIAECQDVSGLIAVKSNFTHLEEVAKEHNFVPVAGILFDLGVSWHQISTPERGFSFQANGPLDMRMDLSLTNTAATLVNTLSVKDLAHIFKIYGEEPLANSVAQKIIKSRPFTTTGELATVIGPSIPIRRRIFQALRIAVNDELSSISNALPKALSLLENNGRLVVISFQSLEDRIVKDMFSDWEKLGLGENLTSSPIVPDLDEISQNPHSKSAKLRVFNKK